MQQYYLTIGSHMKYIYLLLFLTSSLVQASSTVTIAVAANVSYAIKPLVKAFHAQYPQIKIDVILGSSGKLTAQMMHGAPYALLMSADMAYPQRLYEKGWTSQKPVVYAEGALALLSTHTYTMTEEIEKILTTDGVKTIAIANPKTAPYGVATVEALKHLHIYRDIKNKLVYGESISQTVMYATRVADMGIIAMSALSSPQLSHYKQGRDWVALKSTLYSPIAQGMVLMKHAKDMHAAKVFYDFILTPKAQEILHAYGYETP